LKRITDKIEWNQVLSEVKFFDIYHTYDYHKTHSAIDGGSPVMFVYKQDGNIIALPVLERNIINGLLDATSVYGYAGPISNTCDKSIFIRLYKKIILDISRSFNYISIFSRINSEVVNDSISKELFLKKGSTVTIDLKLSEEIQIQQYRKHLRYDIRRLKKENFSCDFVIPDENNINIFIEIYNSTMYSIEASDYYFFDKSYYINLFNNNLADIKMVHCTLHNEITCVGIFFFCNGIVQYHLGANNENYNQSSPTKLMLDFVRNYAYCNNYTVFNLGGGVGGNDDSLLNFKKGFSHNVNEFYLMREILNRDIYNRLSAEKEISDYFPLYRS